MMTIPAVVLVDKGGRIPARIYGLFLLLLLLLISFRGAYLLIIWKNYKVSKYKLITLARNNSFHSEESCW